MSSVSAYGPRPAASKPLGQLAGQAPPNADLPHAGPSPFNGQGSGRADPGVTVQTLQIELAGALSGKNGDAPPDMASGANLYFAAVEADPEAAPMAAKALLDYVNKEADRTRQPAQALMGEMMERVQLRSGNSNAHPAYQSLARELPAELSEFYPVEAAAHPDAAVVMNPADLAAAQRGNVAMGVNAYYDGAMLRPLGAREAAKKLVDDVTSAAAAAHLPVHTMSDPAMAQLKHLCGNDKAHFAYRHVAHEFAQQLNLAYPVEEPEYKHAAQDMPAFLVEYAEEPAARADARAALPTQPKDLLARLRVEDQSISAGVATSINHFFAQVNADPANASKHAKVLVGYMTKEADRTQSTSGELLDLSMKGVGFLSGNDSLHYARQTLRNELPQELRASHPVGEVAPTPALGMKNLPRLLEKVEVLGRQLTPDTLEGFNKAVKGIQAMIARQPPADRPRATELLDAKLEKIEKMDRISSEPDLLWGVGSLKNVQG